ncbi:hypothetical protein BAUCODRAFT_39210 [Baudoinia panamericana UAMH 10762]|uniref:Uncharacterized protein n=1 Tax=Baudoinia panamericana (strain UAMH 10762) TaxID=717646 RepID=M2M3H7_BAUPA|nr:uncharacterized protein BAUCODRAFT_39210 [Baudoinia panamericana UAMH 10762]EMC91086.1 hypothetical protein BAUCODRAFT_39210 [Baudoinia panamericana UAMH 10762]
MVIKKQKPGFGMVPVTEQRPPRQAVSREALRNDVNWENEAEMKALMARKSEAEDAEPYNQPALRSAQARLVAREVAKRSMGKVNVRG